MSCPTLPTCGGKASVPTGLSLWSIIGLVMSAVFGPLLFVAILHLTGFVNMLVSAGLLPAGVTGFAAFAYVAIFLAAVVAAVSIGVWLWSNYANLSSTPPVGTFACVAGVIDQLQPASKDPFSLAHGFIQVVVKCQYWSVITQGSPPFVWCETCQNCPPADWPEGTTQDTASATGCSPMLPCVYRSEAVIDEALGEAIGGTVGAAAGAVLGTLAAIAAYGAMGCAATTVFSWICLLVLLIVLLIALVVVAVASIVGGSIGAGVGLAASPGDTSPTGQGVLTGTDTLTIGDYVRVIGNLVQLADFSGSNAIYFAGWIANTATDQVVDDTQSNGNGTTVFGTSSGSAPFCHTDPDVNISFDPCSPTPPPAPPGQGSPPPPR